MVQLQDLACFLKLVLLIEPLKVSKGVLHILLPEIFKLLKLGYVGNVLRA